MRERDYLVALRHIDGLGTKTIKLLLQHFGKAETVWQLNRQTLRERTNLTGNFIEHFLTNRDRLDLVKILEGLQARKIKTVTIFDETYPANLKEIYDPPPVLFYQGDWAGEDDRAFAIVGSRRATVYGQKVAEKFGRELAEAGLVVVSGMARGIDSCAHRGCLDAGSRTIAVLGSGVDIIYPKENKKLAEQIKEKGVLVSEFPPGTNPVPGNFPARNRIIAGLAMGVLIIEAAARSGALITADFALEAGREVFAVPGPIVSPNSRGTHNLIKQGAKLVDQIGDILEEFGYENEEPSKSVETTVVKLTADEERIYSFLSLTPIRVEELTRLTRWPTSRVQTILTLLELHGLIETVPGKQFVRKNL